MQICGNVIYCTCVHLATSVCSCLFLYENSFLFAAADDVFAGILSSLSPDNNRNKIKKKTYFFFTCHMRQQENIRWERMALVKILQDKSLYTLIERKK